MRASPDLNDYDIKKWQSGTRDYLEFLKGDDDNVFKNSEKQIVILKKWKTRELYALISGVLGLSPNGMMTKLNTGKPMDGLWWWDFVITDGATLLNIMCSNSRVEIHSSSNAKGFDINEFLQFNMEKYKNIIEIRIKRLEVHDSYINHYLSYTRITKFLEQEIRELDISKPPEYDSPALTSKQSNELLEGMKRYSENSIKFHALGKSLILNSAFMAESYISMLTRIGSESHTRDGIKKLKEFNGRNFEYKIINLHQQCHGFYTKIDTSVDLIQDMLNVMTLRNKYAHNDFSSDFNKLEPVYFDDDYPLIDGRNKNYIVDSMETAFHNPDLQTVLESYEVSKKFILYIESLIDPKKKCFFKSIQELTVITQNRETHRYSLIFQPGVAIGLAGITEVDN